MHKIFVLSIEDSEEPDKMPHNGAFHQGIHCLLLGKNDL